MADLNGLDQFEQDLKKLLEERKQLDTINASYNMCVQESYQSSPSLLEEQCGLDPATQMAAREHGQPYNKTPYQGQHIIAKMAAREHGQPYQHISTIVESATNWISQHLCPPRTAQETEQYLEKYGTDQEKHDYYANRCRDRCPTFSGELCEKPGCRKGWRYK